MKNFGNRNLIRIYACGRSKNQRIKSIPADIQRSVERKWNQYWV